MAPKLSQELIDVLRQQGDQPIQVVDPTNNHVYVVVDFETHQQAMKAKQTLDDLEAIQEGIDDMEAGRMQPVDVAFAEIRQKLLARKR